MMMPPSGRIVKEMMIFAKIILNPSREPAEFCSGIKKVACRTEAIQKEV
jgi:hypothetical protein